MIERQQLRGFVIQEATAQLDLIPTLIVIH